MKRTIPSQVKQCHTRSSTLPEYAAWKLMIQRCRNTNHPLYPRYGGNSVRVYDQWQGRTGFVQFLEDVGRRPQPRVGLRRLDSARDFEPGNVEWANTRACRLLTYQGKTQSIKAWAEQLGVRADALHARLHKRKPIDEVLGRKVKSRGPYWKDRVSKLDVDEPLPCERPKRRP